MERSRTKLDSWVLYLPETLLMYISGFMDFA